MGWEEQETGEVYQKGSGKEGQPKTKLVRCQVRHNAFIDVDEGEMFTKLSERSGSTLGATIRSAWYGATVGNQNADPNRRRILPAGTYSLGMFIGFQPDTVLPLLRDASAGTPQRFVYSSSIDPSIPLDAWAALRPRQFITTSAKMYLAPPIAAEVKRDHHERTTGAVTLPRLNAHRNLTKIKLAALLALLDSRHVVNEEDWELAGVMWDTSAKVRDHYLAEGQALENRERYVRDVHYGEREGMAEQARQTVRDASSKVVRVARLIAKYVHDPVKPSRTTGDAHRRLESVNRPHFSEALHLAEEESWIEVDGDQLRPGQSKPA
jgi:hypothetical protein